MLSTAASAAKNFSFIRDAEIENTIRAYATPLFQTAGLDPSAIDIYLINDNTLNAFVAGGQKLFINSGLLKKSEHAGQVIGVIAHETGHIAGGHLSRTHDQLKNSRAQSIIAYVLGGAAAIATGRPDVGQAIAMGGEQVGLRSFLQYSRTQESAADQAAIRFLDAAGFSSRGTVEFLEAISGQELLSAKRQDPYLRTHPLTRERISTLRQHLANSPIADKPLPPDFQEMHRRMRAKLFAFTEPYVYTLRRYKPENSSLEARYARAIAHYRRSDLGKALPLIDGLIAENPQDPYFHELRGQMLFENAHAAEALGSYRTAVNLLPGSALLRQGLAQVQLEMNDPALLSSAIANLRAAMLHTPDSPPLWRQLAIAYGRQGKMGLSSLAMAEEALLKGNSSEAAYYAGRAEKLLAKDSTFRLQAQDILRAAKKGQEKKNK